MVPFARNPRFVGRQNVIDSLEQSIFHSRGPKKTAIYGLGGIGKTQVALELAYRAREKVPGISIFWIPCTNYENVEQAYLSVASSLEITGIDPAEVKERVKRFLSQGTAGKWLLIFDNADDMEMWTKGRASAPPLKDILPQSEDGHVLFTSRNRKLVVKLASPNVLSIPEMDQRTAKKLFENSLIQKGLLQDGCATTAILEQLGFLPLAISQAAAYINENDISLSEYLSLLGEQERSTIEMLSEEFEEDGRYAEIQNPVATTWWISFSQIQQLDGLAADYLSFMACIDPRDIPQSIFPPAASAKEQAEAIGLLKAYSFVTAQVRDGRFSLHRLVHLATRNWMRTNKTLHIWAERAACQLDDVFPDDEHGNRKIWRDYLPHALYLTKSEEFQSCRHDYYEFLSRVGKCLESDGRYNEAQTLFTDVLEITETVLGPEHPYTLISVNNLGAVLERQGKYGEAETMHRRALECREKALGPEHPHTLTSISNLGAALEREGEYEAAEIMHQRALQGYEKVLGPEHPYTLTSVSNLGAVLERQGKYKEAEAMHRRALAGCETALGPEHPNSLTSVSNLGSVLERQGKYKEAEAMHRQALEGSEKALGREHPYTFSSISNLGLVLERQGKYEEAEAMHQRALEGYEKALGPEHPYTLSSISHIGLVLGRQGKYEEAEAMHRQALEGYETALGSEHPHTLISASNCGSVLERQGKYEEAEAMHRRALEGSEKALGPEHPYTLSSVSHIGLVLERQGKGAVVTIFTGAKS
jgi:tetratricopeptide (TPR) repeat protein